MIEKKLIQAILEGEYKSNEPLLPERELAIYFNVGRPTVREAIQRLERNGWITARKGMPAIVNDYWKHGNLMTIVNILQCYEEIPDVFIEYMLQLRISLTPSYVKQAVVHHPLKVIALFSQVEELKDDAKSYATYDWELQKELAQLSSNPIYLFIINSFTDIYIPMAEKYFAEPYHRSASRQYYGELLNAILKADIQAAEEMTKNMMEKSLQLWKTKTKESEK
ncbi:GntR family transcriptional regulator [Cytobacillus sp. FJAT-53684]|uniref:GntR family transcriptional regulator n=1 Tax=Cytobacillus mangrovibacter TaxID=3299024 RepID=A0ABW6JVL7_9BACI